MMAAVLVELERHERDPGQEGAKGALSYATQLLRSNLLIPAPRWLTAITAWEALFDRLDVRKPVPGAASAILIIGGAGGVGSIATQLVRQLTDLTAITTASRPETAEWSRGLGAHHVVDHAKPLASEVERLGIGAPSFVFSTTNTDKHLAEIGKLIALQLGFGHFA